MEELAKLQREFSPAEISFGVGGIKIFSPEVLARQQVGYSIGTDGTDLCTGEVGAWQKTWVVIGYETGLGDPIFVDNNFPALPVFTAFHGEGVWEPHLIASSVTSFASELRHFQEITTGRATPAERDANPISETERTEFLQRIAGASDSPIHLDFWDALLEL